VEKGKWSEYFLNVLYVTRRGNQKQHPLERGASLEMLSSDRTQTRNSFTALDPETSASSSLGASKVPGGTCAFALCSGSLTDGFYLWLRSSELPHSTDSEAVLRLQLIHHPPWILLLARVYRANSSVLEEFAKPLMAREEPDLFSSSFHHRQFYHKEYHDYRGKNPVLSWGTGTGHYTAAYNHSTTVAGS
jgi:hypothetical protein